MIFETASAALTFILAGNSRITVVSKIVKENEREGKRYTYRIRKSEDGKVHFVQVMYGPNNEQDFVFIGLIKEGKFIANGKRIPVSDPRTVGFNWIFGNLQRGELKSEQMTILHENRCGRCARTLTTPESILSGYGPECIGKIVCQGV